MNSQVILGPLARRVKEGAKWTDSYPNTQAWADELEQLLIFVLSHGVLDECLPRLQSSNGQRDVALAELRIAQFLARNGFKPQAGIWKPNGGATPDGELTIHSGSGSPVVVQVKYQSWQGELTKEESHAGRAKQPQYDREERAVEPWVAIQGTIEKAYGKLKDQTPSLLILPDNLFMSLSHDPDMQAWMALYANPQIIAVNPRRVQSGCFTDSRYENLGGVGIFQVRGDGYAPVEYGMELYVNAFALPGTRLPRDIVKALRGIRLWDDPTKPTRGHECRRLGDDGRLDHDTILKILEAKRDTLRQYGVKSLSLFGSAARGENDPGSDLDFVVELDLKTFSNYMGLKEYLENLFGCRIDLALAESIRPALRDSILSECVHAARV